MNKEEKTMPEIKFDVVKEFGVISENPKNGWSRELNLVSWNDREPKYELRDWSADKSKMNKGFSMTADEVKTLRDILNSIDL